MREASFRTRRQEHSDSISLHQSPLDPSSTWPSLLVNTVDNAETLTFYQTCCWHWDRSTSTPSSRRPKARSIMSGISNLTTTDAPLWETPENHGPLVSVVTWFLVITAFLSVLARLGTRYAVVRSFRWDDAFIVLAIVWLCSLGQRERLADDPFPAFIHRPFCHYFAERFQRSWPTCWLTLDPQIRAVAKGTGNVLVYC